MKSFKYYALVGALTANKVLGASDGLICVDSLMIDVLGYLNHLRASGNCTTKLAPNDCIYAYLLDVQT